MFKLILIATLTFSFALPAAAQTGAVVAGKSPGAAGIAQTVKVPRRLPPSIRRRGR